MAEYGGEQKDRYGLLANQLRPSRAVCAAQSIEGYFAFWRARAKAYLELEKHDSAAYARIARERVQAGVLDLASAAAEVLKQIDRIEAYRNAGDFELALREALILSTLAHQLDVQDFGPDIARARANEKQIPRAREKNTLRKEERQNMLSPIVLAEIEAHPRSSPNDIFKKFQRHDPAGFPESKRRTIVRDIEEIMEKTAQIGRAMP